MDRFLDQAWLAEQYRLLVQWVLENIVSLETAAEISIIAIVFLVARMTGRKVETLYLRWAEAREAETDKGARLRRIGALMFALAQPFIWLILLWVLLTIAEALEWPHRLLVLATSLLTAWVVIRLSTYLLGASPWSKTVAVAAWSIAALNILGLLDPTFDMLDGAALHVGELRLSAFSVISGLVTLTVLIWLALSVSRLIERRISAITDLTPSVKLLLGNLIRITLLTIAIIAGLGAVGIDLTAFAVFGGALGVGVGFGLQKVVSNFVSGIILLLDRSVKPGDVIVIGETYGWVNSLGARYTSVITRDGAEHLIPNEDLITQRVENWTHTDRLIRLKLPVGISYHSDVRRAIELCLEAAGQIKRVIDLPEPRCLLKGFGDSSVDLELRFWIRDPANGISNVKSDILLAVWDRFQEHNIEIPFPQLDLHVHRGGARPAPAGASVD